MKGPNAPYYLTWESQSAQHFSTEHHEKDLDKLRSRGRSLVAHPNIYNVRLLSHDDPEFCEFFER